MTTPTSHGAGNNKDRVRIAWLSEIREQNKIILQLPHRSACETKYQYLSNLYSPARSKTHASQ